MTGHVRGCLEPAEGQWIDLQDHIRQRDVAFQARGRHLGVGWPDRYLAVKLQRRLADLRLGIDRDRFGSGGLLGYLEDGCCAQLGRARDGVGKLRRTLHVQRSAHRTADEEMRCRKVAKGIIVDITATPEGH